MRNAIMTNIVVSLVMNVDVFDNVLVKTVDSICLFVRKLVSEDFNVEVTNSWQKLLRFLTVNMVQYRVNQKFCDISRKWFYFKSKQNNRTIIHCFKSYSAVVQ